jgi:hypothetical protein
MSIVEDYRSLLRLAEAGEWETVAEREVAYRARLETHLRSEALARDPVAGGRSLKELLAIAGRLTELAKAARDQTRREAAAVRRAREADRAYRQHGRP